MECEERLHVWHQFVIRTNDREQLKAYLAENGIDTMIHYPHPPSEHPCYRNIPTDVHVRDQSLRLSSGLLSLPIDPYLSTEESEYVVDRVRKYFLDRDVG